MPIHTDDFGWSPMKPVSTSSGQTTVSQPRRKSGMFASLTRAGLISMRPGLSGTIVESMWVDG